LPCPGAHLAIVGRVGERAPEGVRVVWSDESIDIDAMLLAAH
jgi:hypothetical protein